MPLDVSCNDEIREGHFTVLGDTTGNNPLVQIACSSRAISFITLTVTCESGARNITTVTSSFKDTCLISGVSRNFVREGWVQKIQLRTDERQNGYLGAVAPWSGFLEPVVIWYKKFHFI